MKISANFTGALDRDSDDRFVKEGDYRILENGIIDRDEDGGRYILKNLRSTSLVSDINEYGKFVGGKERRGFYYAFFYEEAVRTLTLYRIDLSSGVERVVFQRVLEDTYLIDDMKSFEYTPPSYEGLALFDFFQRYTFGTPYVYMATSIVSNQEFSVVTGDTPGAAFVDIADINEYFRVVNAGSTGAYVLCKVPIVVNGSAIFNQSFANGLLNPFTSVADFSSIFTVKNKGLAGEYVLCNVPLRTYGDFGVNSVVSFSNATLFVSLVYKEDEVIDENAIYKSITYNHVNKILSIDFVENQSNGDLLCYWTDGVNPPFAINVNFLLDGGQYPHVRDMFNIKPSPAEPRVQFYRDYSSSDVNTRVLNFQFAQRHLYKDGDYTPLSTFSQSAFIPNKIIGASSSDSANVGYYLEAGILYKFTGFNTGNKTPLYNTGDVSYNRVLCSPDGSFFFIWTAGGTGKPVLTSTNYGADFEAWNAHQWEGDGCMSDDGRYIYMSSTDLWRSSDYGKTFTNIQGGVGNLSKSSTKMKCSNDGRYLVGVRFYRGLDPVDIVDYFHPFMASDYGANFTYVKGGIVGDLGDGMAAGFYPDRAAAVSESGRNIVFVCIKKLFISRDFGQTFSVTDKPVAVDIMDMIIYDNGRGFADGHSTNNFFQTWNDGFFAFTNSLRYNYAIVIKEATTEDWVKVGLDGSEIARAGIPSPPAFTDEVDVRTSLKSVENFVNTVDIQIQKPSPIVDKVEVFAIDTDSGLAYIIDTIKNNIEELPSGGTVVTFKNNLVYRVLSDTEKNVLFSNIPKTSKLQSIVGNRLFYFDYTEGYDGFSPDFSAEMTNRVFRSLVLTTSLLAAGNQLLVTSGDEGNYTIEIGDIITVAFTYTDVNGVLSIFRFQYRFNSGYNTIIDAAAEIQASWRKKFPQGSVLASGSGLNFNLGINNKYIDIQIASVNEVPLTYKSGHSMSVGMVYCDEYNRGNFPIFDDSDVFVSADLSKPKNELKVTIRHKAPEWAVGYKFVRTDRNLHYQIIPGFQFAKVERGSVYLMKYDSDLYLPEPGMYLDTITNDGDIISFAVTGKVMRDVDFVAGSPAGEWIVIQAPDTPGYMTQDVSNGTHKFFDTIFYSRQNIEAADDVLFYEIPGVYRIRDGNHVGNFATQDFDEKIPAEHIIKHDGNCFNITSANVELVSIGNEMTFVNGGRALVAIENPRKIHRYSSLTWSEVFSQTSGINGLSMFNALLGNSKHLEPSNGDINAILPIETNITLWQEDQVGQILVNKNALVTATGDQVVGRSSDVVGDFVPYAGEYGTIHPESIVSFGGVRFFVDVKRNAVCRIGQEGIYEIQAQGMSAVFNKVLDKNDLYISSINPDHKEFWLYSDAQREIFVYNYAQNAWVRTIKPIRMTDMFNSGKLVYSLDSTQEVRLYSHMSSVGYGQIYGEPAPLKFEYVANVEPGIVKVYEALELEANRPVPITISVAGSYNSGEEFNSSDVTEEMFEFREGEYFSYISGANNSKIGNEEGVIVPIGVIKSVDGTVVTFTSKITAPIGLVNHSVFVHDGSESGTFKSLLNSDSQIGEDFINTSGFDQSDVGKFVFLIEKSYLNGHKLRAPFVRVTMTDDNFGKLGVFACRLRVNKSYNE